VNNTPARIDPDKCDGCGTCVEACPTEAISIGDDGKAKVNEDECAECESCVDECPNNAISME
jgi:NAD-dependent dihydropyrimidine dehydrogenase PreA subunit